MFIVMRLLYPQATYGIKVESENNRFLVLSEDTTIKLGEAGVPGTYLVDIFPVCKAQCYLYIDHTPKSISVKHVPAWFPGAGFRRELEALRKQVAEMVNSPIMAVKEAMVISPEYTSFQPLLMNFY